MKETAFRSVRGVHAFVSLTVSRVSPRSSSSYLRDRDKSDYAGQDPLYTLSQRFDSSVVYDSQQRRVSA